MMSDRQATHFLPNRLKPGTRLNGLYEIDHLVGIGGMGEIYKGHAIETHDPVAIKLMLPELAENEAALALFRKEASALHHLQHEAIVRYYVFTIEPELRRPYLAMEFVNGRSLSAILQDDGPLSFEAVCSLMGRMAAGLQAAHDCGIIHRDVSPDNIIVPGGDVTRAKIIDFGIARSTQLSESTVIGSGFAGKHNYVSPEQLGLFGGDVTLKSDIYSLGLVLVQALTGRPLDMGGTQFQIVEKRRNVPDLGAVDMRFRPLLERMLQPHPDQRPESMAAIAAWSFDRPTNVKVNEERPTASLPENGDGPRRRRWQYAAAALLMLAVIAGASGGYYHYAMNAPGLDPALGRFSPSPSAKAPEPQPTLATTPAAPAAATAVRPPAAQSNDAGKSAATGAPLPGREPTVLSGAEKIRRYVEQYDGGECFFVTPVAIGESKTAIEGFGASLQPFNGLDEAFKRDNGFAADIGIRQVTVSQCPAITFLGRLREWRARAPRVDLDKLSLRSGEALTGTIDRIGARNIELLLVWDGGLVQNVSDLLKAGTDAKTFSIGMPQRDGVAGSQPQLLVAVASLQPLASLRPARSTAASEFFPAVLREAERTIQTLSATARYFKLER
jgi:serine/threonine protein kinase